MNIVLQNLINHVTAQADLNGDKKVDRADWDLVVSHLRTEAATVETAASTQITAASGKYGPVATTLTALGVGLAAGFLVHAVFFARVAGG